MKKDNEILENPGCNWVEFDVRIYLFFLQIKGSIPRLRILCFPWSGLLMVFNPMSMKTNCHCAGIIERSFLYHLVQ